MKLSLAINSHNPNLDWFRQLMNSAKGFDDIVIYIDGKGIEKPDWWDSDGHNATILCHGTNMSVVEGFNYAIQTCFDDGADWVIPMCDDDYFNPDVLKRVLDGFRAGLYDGFDIVHGQCITNEGLWGESSFTLTDLMRDNRLPFSSFYTKKVFERLKGYNHKVGAYNDWNFWIRAKMNRFKFKYVDGGLYNFRQGHESYTVRQLKKSSHLMNKIKVIANV